MSLQSAKCALSGSPVESVSPLETALTRRRVSGRSAVIDALHAEMAETRQQYEMGLMSELVYLAEIHTMAELAFDTAFRMIGSGWTDSPEMDR